MDDRAELRDIAARMQNIVDRPSTMEDFLRNPTGKAPIDTLGVIPPELDPRRKKPNIIDPLTFQERPVPIHGPPNNKGYFYRKKLLVLCYDEEEFYDFCRDKSFHLEMAIPINRDRFNLASDMNDGYYTVLDKFLSNTSQEYKERVIGYIQSRGYKYIRLGDL